MKKFDFVVGNPPYQDENIGDSTQEPPIYHLFVDESSKISVRTLLITPARFLFNAGATPKSWNRKMLNDPHFKVLYYNQNSGTIFYSTDIKGGVAILYLDKTKSFEPIEVFTPYDELNSIIDKLHKLNYDPLSSIMSGQNTYKFTDLLHEENIYAESRLSKGHKYDLTTSIFMKLPEIFIDNPEVQSEYFRIIGRINNKREFKWVKKKYIRKNDNLDKYKVVLPKSNGTGILGESLSSPLVIPPNTGFTQTFISAGYFENETEANNLLTYIKTKFLRAILGVYKITQDNPPEKWKLVPLQDFTTNSDIDWSKSIAEIDQQLYKKYGLSPEEIDFIEEKVQEME